MTPRTAAVPGWCTASWTEKGFSVSTNTQVRIIVALDTYVLSRFCSVTSVTATSNLRLRDQNSPVQSKITAKNTKSIGQKLVALKHYSPGCGMLVH